jgi:hypothetical protein
MAASSTKLKKPPDWAKQALQGVTFWMGHRRSFYRRHPLTEGAMIAEICNLIHANLTDGLELTCEVLYSKLLPEKPTAKERKQILTELARADLVVSDGPLDFDGKPKPKFIIEVKRGSTPDSEIDSDLRRLAEAKRRFRDARAFLFLISEARRPKRFVNKEGMSRKRDFPIPNSKGYFRVRGTAKAAHALTKRDRAQYACLVEVFA